MPAYELVTTPPARKALKRLPRQVRHHIVEVAANLKDNPEYGDQLQSPWKFLRSLHTIYRRTHYRLVYEVDVSRKYIFIHFVNTRENFYQKLRRLKLKPMAAIRN